MESRLALLFVTFVLLSWGRAQEPAAANDPLRAVLEAPVETSVAEGLVVEVVDEAGKPVPGAIVGFVAADSDPRDEARRRQYEALLKVSPAQDEDRRTAATLLVFGTRYRTDADGRAILPKDAKRPIVACGNGVAVVESNAAAAGPVRIVLRRANSVRVRVVDPDGKPVAGALLRLGRDDMPVSGLSGAFTDRLGEAVVPVPRYMRNAQRLRIVASLGGADDPKFQFAGDAVPAELQTLTLPPTGMVRVIVYGDDEKPLTNVTNVVLNLDGSRGPGLALAGQPESSGAVFRVALGKSFTVHATLQGVSGELRGTCTGPTQPNELVVCDVRATQGPPVVSFVVRGLDGAPVGDEDLGCVQFCAQWSNGRELRSDREGRMRIVLPETRPDDLELLVLRRGRGSGPQPVSLYEGAARVPLPRELKAGENVLPDVKLAEEPVYVAGQVVDEDGKPVSKAVVECAPGWSRPTGGHAGGSVRQFFQHRVITDGDGRFEVRDAAPSESIRVSARAVEPGIAPASEESAAGTQAMKLVLRRTGRVTIALDGLPKTSHTLLKGAIEPAGGGSPVRLDIRDAATTVQLPAGRYDLVLRLDDNTAELWRIADLEVVRGADCADPRLQLPWRDLLTLVTLTVIDRDQKPVRGHQVMQWIAKSGGYSATGGLTDQEGKFAVLVPKQGGGQLAIRASKGLRGARLDGVTTDQTVVLLPEIAVAIELRGDHAVPEGITAAFQLRPVAGPDRRDLQQLLRGTERPVLRAGKAGIFEAAVAEPTAFEMLIVVTEKIDARRTRPHTFRWGTIDVKDQAEPQSFVLDMPAEERAKLTALLERLKQ